MLFWFIPLNYEKHLLFVDENYSFITKHYVSWNQCYKKVSHLRNSHYEIFFQAIMSSALKGELGPWAQAVAKHQIEQKLKTMLEKYKVKTEESPKIKDKSESTDSKVCIHYLFLIFFLINEQ